VEGVPSYVSNTATTPLSTATRRRCVPVSNASTSGNLAHAERRDGAARVEVDDEELRVAVAVHVGAPRGRVRGAST
jgi:hypothetical protein